MTKQEYEVLCARLEAAVTALTGAGCYLQAIARKYYVVYTTAKYLAGVHGVYVTHPTKSGTPVKSQDFRHNEIADVIRCLYTGLKRGYVTDEGSSPGLTGTALTDADASKLADVLQADRKLADYSGLVQEPYTPAQAQERLNRAQTLAEDLRKLI